MECARTRRKYHGHSAVAHEQPVARVVYELAAGELSGLPALPVVHEHGHHVALMHWRQQRKTNKQTQCESRASHAGSGECLGRTVARRCDHASLRRRR